MVLEQPVEAECGAGHALPTMPDKSPSSDRLKSQATKGSARPAAHSHRRDLMRFIRVSWQGDPFINFPVTTDTVPFSCSATDLNAKVGQPAMDQFPARFLSPPHSCVFVSS